MPLKDSDGQLRGYYAGNAYIDAVNFVSCALETVDRTVNCRSIRRDSPLTELNPR